MIILPNCKDIVDIVAGLPGPKSGINVFRENQVKFDKQQKFQGDERIFWRKNY